MTELYWMTTLGNIGDIAFSVAMLSLIVIIAMLIFLAIDKLNIDTEKEQEEYDSHKSFFIKFVCFSIIPFLMAVFIPSKKDMYVIYGIGGTIDYILSSDDAKKLPDNCIKALDIFTKTYIEETNETN